MTSERRQDLLVVALVLSVALHVGLMLFVRARVMTRVVRDGLNSSRREAMRVDDYRPVEDPVAIERIRDIMSVREAPEAEAPEALRPSTEQIPDDAAQHWDGDVPAPSAPEADAVPVAPERFDVAPLSLDANLAPDPLPKVEYTPPESRTLTAPESAPGAGLALPVAFGAPAPDVAAPVFDASEPAERILAQNRPQRARPEFRPAEEVYEQVDEKAVEAEKAAVRELMSVDDAAPLEKFVNVTALKSETNKGTFFKLMVSPRTALPVVPKDVVILLDASGSIGSERLVSCRLAAKKILRSAFNSGDRFNLVAFRNRFTYAFRRWQDCSQASFDAADKWLANLTAHGRTDVFGTISSVLTLPRDPTRPLIALVVTDGEANAGVSDTSEILSKFTALNDGLVSVYMYGVKSAANRELINVLTHGNRGESFIYGGIGWKAGTGIESLSERFRDPVLSDIRLVFTSASRATVLPRVLRNLYRGDVVTVIGFAPPGVKEVAFSLKGLSGSKTYEGFFRVPLDRVASSAVLAEEWAEEAALDQKLK